LRNSQCRHSSSSPLRQKFSRGVPPVSARIASDNRNGVSTFVLVTDGGPYNAPRQSSEGLGYGPHGRCAEANARGYGANLSSRSCNLPPRDQTAPTSHRSHRFLFRGDALFLTLTAILISPYYPRSPIVYWLGSAGLYRVTARQPLPMFRFYESKDFAPREVSIAS